MKIHEMDQNIIGEPMGQGHQPYEKKNKFEKLFGSYRVKKVRRRPRKNRYKNVKLPLVYRDDCLAQYSSF